jgi:transglutaminase-like putative cysteine protease
MRNARIAFVAVTLAAPASLGAEPQVEVAGAPSWVEGMDLPLDHAPPEDVHSGIHYLIVDRQVRVKAGATERYYRRAFKVLSTAGVQEASEIKATFDPSYERLVFHEVRLWRAGRNVRRFSREDVTVVHEESDQSARLFRGSVSAIVFLEDVRPDDVVDYSFTVVGANPVFEGRFAGVFELAYGFPVARLRHRLLWPPARPLRLKPHDTELEPRVRDSGGVRSYDWEREDVPAVRSEDETPGWYDPRPFVEASEFQSWNEVARWASGLFAGQGRPSPRFSALVRQIESAPGEMERALRAIRFVQDDVRYLGIEMGPSSHRPHPPEWVLEQRYGDCKDKALLLVALLRALGMEANPALVNTSLRRGLDERQPSPLAFDHAIVLATIGGAPVWIDATRSETGGAPEAFEPPPFERALLVREEARGLMTIPPAHRADPTVVVEESYRVGAAGAPARLAVKTTYRGRDADEKRQSLARVSQPERAQSYLNHYAREDPTVRALAAPAFRDDREANVLVEEEHYELPGFWTEGRHDFYAWAVGGELRRPASALRSMPLAVKHPVHLEHKLTIELPEPLDIEPHRQLVRSPGFSLGSRSEVLGRRVTLTYSYRSLDSAVPASETRRHLDALDKAERALGYRVDLSWRRSASARDEREPGSGWWGVGVLAVAVAGLGGLGLRAARRRARLQSFQALQGLSPGESPAEPLRSAPEGLVAYLALRECACGARGRLEETERHPVNYDGQSMEVVTCRCASCGNEHALYVLPC